MIAIEAILSPALSQEPSAPSLDSIASWLRLDSCGDSPTRTLAPSGKAPGWSQRAFACGEVIENTYAVGDVLGHGGMAQVFSAVDLTTGREVAIKTTWSRKDDDTLHNEAAILAGLRHPGIVGFHALSSHRGIPYLVLEHLRGSSLQADTSMWHPGNERPMDRVLDCLIGVCDTLEMIHASGYAHRDLKPQNIVLVNDDARRPVLIDFGLAIHESDASRDLRMAGSPHYIAPEAIRSCIERNRVHLIDIYALGVLAFELLTGRPPFQHGKLRRILDMHLHVPPPCPSRYNRSVPEPLGQLVTEMMGKLPERRPGSAAGIAARLRELRYQ